MDFADRVDRVSRPGMCCSTLCFRVKEHAFFYGSDSLTRSRLVALDLANSKRFAFAIESQWVVTCCYMSQ